MGIPGGARGVHFILSAADREYAYYPSKRGGHRADVDIVGHSLLLMVSEEKCGERDRLVTNDLPFGHAFIFLLQFKTEHQ